MESLAKQLARLVVMVMLVVTASLSWSPAAAAAPSSEDVERAATLKKDADTLMRKLQYEDALANYDESYRLDPKPALLYNRGRAQQALNRMPDALDSYETFKREAPDHLRRRVPKLDELIDEVRAQVSSIQIDCNVPGAEVVLGDRVLGKAPMAEPIRVNAGDATLEVRADKHKTITEQINLTAGEVFTKRYELEQLFGTLLVRSVLGATVIVDGKTIGTAPTKAELSPGQHTVDVEFDGYLPASLTVVVEAGVTKPLEMPLEEEPGLHEQWWLWTSVGAVVVAVVVIAAVSQTEKAPDEGTIPPGQVAASIFTF